MGYANLLRVYINILIHNQKFIIAEYLIYKIFFYLFYEFLFFYVFINLIFKDYLARWFS